MSLNNFYRGLGFLAAIITFCLLVLVLALTKKYFILLDSQDANLSADTITAIGVAFIALAAFIVALWQGYITRRHNRMSVRPNLSFTYRAGEGNPAEIILQNNGVGPAIITKFEYEIEGTRFDGTTSKGVYRAIEAAVAIEGGTIDLIGSAGDITPNGGEIISGNVSTNIFFFDIGDPFAQGESKALIAIMPTIDDQEMKTKLDKSIQRMSVHIEYESIYEEQFSKIARGRFLLLERE